MQQTPEHTNEIRTLAVEQAEQLAKHKGDLYLDGLTTLTPEVVAVLRAGLYVKLPDLTASQCRRGSGGRVRSGDRKLLAKKRRVPCVG